MPWHDGRGYRAVWAYICDDPATHRGPPRGLTDIDTVDAATAIAHHHLYTLSGGKLPSPATVLVCRLLGSTCDVAVLRVTSAGYEQPQHRSPGRSGRRRQGPGRVGRRLDASLNLSSLDDAAEALRWKPGTPSN